MATAEISVLSSASERYACYKCGAAFGRRKGCFPVNYADLYKGVGYLPYCKSCVDKMYDSYYAICGDRKMALRQVCRKLDIYWNDAAFEQVAKRTAAKSIMTAYMNKLALSNALIGKSYDQTLEEEGVLWAYAREDQKDFVPPYMQTQTESFADNIKEEPASVRMEDIDKDVVDFWGSGYPPEMYNELEARRAYYMNKIGDSVEMSVGFEGLIRQICNLEVSIAHDNAAGRSTDKSVNALNTLFGSLNFKPAQQKGDSDASVEKTPLGVWIRKWETQRPIPEVDKDLRDVDKIGKYISIWFYGHLCKMLGIKNAYSKLYEEELQKFRVERPEFDEDDDEEMVYQIFKDGGDEE